MKRFLVVLGVLIAGIAIAIVGSRDTPPEPQPVAAEGSQPAPPDWAVEITYVANEGVLISSRGKRVLIDGLHREYKTYSSLPEPYLSRLETAQAPFDKIDLILVSHVHRDHFHPESVGRYLQNNPGARLVSSQQVVDQMRDEFAGYAGIASQVSAQATPGLKRVALTVAGVELEMFALSHGTGRHRDIQNLGHLVTLAGRKFLHVGDADPASANLEAFKLDEAGIDVAFLPGWFLNERDNAAAVREHIRPGRIIGVHALAGDRLTDPASFPGAALFTVLLEKVYLK